MGKGKGGKGKGHGKGISQAQAAQQQAAHFAALEHQFYEQAEILWQSLGDLSLPNHVLSNEWTHLLASRSGLMQAYNGKGCGKGGAMAALPAALPDVSQLDWKGSFAAEFARLNHRSATSDDIGYDVQEIAGNKPGVVSGYKATMSVNTDRGMEVFEGEVATNKKAAEKLACKSAVAVLFPHIHDQMISFPQAGGVKRKAGGIAEAPAEALESKSKLNQALCLLLGRNPMKGDAVFDTSETEDRAWISQVVLVTDPEVAYQGEVQPNKKAAENSAAEAALVALQDRVTPLEQEHKAKKARANREKLEALKQRKVEKTLA
jgi:hypothetical protein